MKLVKIICLDTSSNRESEIFLNAAGRFEVFNSIGDQLSRAYPVKDYKTKKAAEKYANQFLTA